MDMVRLGASLGYLAATGVWLILMGVAGGLRCDDGCSGPPYRGWEDNIHAWQYGVLAPLALAGATLALLAVILALGGLWLGRAALALHVCVFIGNVGILTVGSHLEFPISLLLLAPLAAAAGFVATAPRDIPGLAQTPFDV